MNRSSHFWFVISAVVVVALLSIALSSCSAQQDRVHEDLHSFTLRDGTYCVMLYTDIECDFTARRR